MIQQDTVNRAGLSCLFVCGLLALSGCGGSGSDEEKAEPTEVAVQVAKIVRTTLTVKVEAYARVEPEPAGNGVSGGVAKLATVVSGIVADVRATEGEAVENGDVLVQLDDRIAKAALDKAAHAVEYAEKVLARQNKLLTVGGTSDKVVQEAAQQLATARGDLSEAQTQLALTRIATPIRGTVARLPVHPGQTVDASSVVAEVVDLSKLSMTASVTPEEAPKIAIGNPVRLVNEKGEDKDTIGAISFVSPQVDPATGSVAIRSTLVEPGGMRLGQVARVRIACEERRGRLAVPKESIVTDIEGHSVIAIVDGDKANQRVVKTGVHDGNLVEVEGEGVKEGDEVVTVGAYGLPKETRIKIAGR